MTLTSPGQCVLPPIIVWALGSPAPWSDTSDLCEMQPWGTSSSLAVPSPSLRFLWGDIPMSWGPRLKSDGHREGHKVSRKLPQSTQGTEGSESCVAQGSKPQPLCPSLDGAKDASTRGSRHAFTLYICYILYIL